MFMRFVGGGIGHKSTDSIQQLERLSTSVPEELEDPILHDDQEDITPGPHTQDHVQGGPGGEDDDIEGDPEEAGSDEEVDYGYADDSPDRESESDDHDSERDDSEGEVGTDDKEDDALSQ